MSNVILRPFEPADTDWLVERHATLYARDEGFDDTFGPLVRNILEAFCAEHDPTCEQGWIAVEGDQRLGSVFCVRLDAETAKLRLFLLVPEARGKGVGRRLLEQCMGFARDNGYEGMQLWTHESHSAACALYRRAGWMLTESHPVRSFGQDLVEQTWIYRF
ncbi:GNAT family N-acetyltransferase [Tateyamaria sp. Alg231-49]|uniref:GNAT family N-acetyltransferase n=1 Tax=Tateyamaria sp. Alg231-49 TaxID=1922219 RepID=UPI000D558766|nr:GNAT family N-acetyltransferase [Tateyamaria sp. Alg231-49]